jgi:GNAT superfamily N-acetyltransferase
MAGDALAANSGDRILQAMATIRGATPDDAQALAGLRYEFRAAERGAAEPRDRFVERCTAWMRERLHEGSWRCFVAQVDGAIVGHVWLCLIEKVPNPGGDEPERHAYLTNLYVRPSARGGTGSALMDRAIAWCRDQQVDTVLLWPSERSRSLYARYGFRTTDAIMARAAPSP